MFKGKLDKNELDSVWNSEQLSEATFINFSDDVDTIEIRFLQSEPETSKNKFGTLQFSFEVLDMKTNKVMIHTITSKRYMRELKNYIPLEGKTFNVRRIGNGMDTLYEVNFKENEE